MIAITLPGMVVLLLPIIAIETVVIVRRTFLARTKTLWVTTLANLASTIVGVPLTWLCLVVCEMGLFATLSHVAAFESRFDRPFYRIVGTILSVPWLGPIDRNDDWWALPLATLALLVPFFFVSVWVEQRVAEYFLPVTTASDAQPNEVNEDVLLTAVRDANLFSYGFLFIFAMAWLFWGAVHH
jgi:hypothetical protein